MVALRKDIPTEAFTGKLAPCKSMPTFARIAVPLHVNVVTRIGMLGIQVKDVCVDGTDVDSFGERFYWGTIDGITFCYRADRLEAFLGIAPLTDADAMLQAQYVALASLSPEKQNDAFAPSH